MKTLLTIMYLGVMLAAVFQYSGGVGTGDYTDWQAIEVNGKSRTPQGAFFVKSGDSEFVVYGSYKETRSFWYQVDYFDQIKVRITEGVWGGERIAALIYRGELVYGTQDYEKGLRVKRTSSVQNMKYFSITYLILMGLIILRERKAYH
ncbi:hypothetical protein [Marinobacter adhaerens]|uniref:hypothetical protein n=1 Tax=Marinobacter adhaerens TaxID=1033846 RepID=UPI001C5A0B5D|nr:hypothetical protein [Marinobacter adhaerens]MBW3227750.1 hypothetical protein [Marinobacter adhaerens]